MTKTRIRFLDFCTYCQNVVCIESLLPEDYLDDIKHSASYVHYHIQGYCESCSHICIRQLTAGFILNSIVDKPKNSSKLPKCFKPKKKSPNDQTKI